MAAVFSALEQEKHEQIAVDERVLVAGSRTIVIANIAHVELLQTRDNRAGKILLVILAILVGLPGLLMVINGVAAGIVLLLISCLLIWRAVSLKSQFGMTITTNDGSRTWFVGNDIERLKYAMEYVTWKINSADQVSRNTINFNNSNIANSQIGGRIQN